MSPSIQAILFDLGDTLMYSANPWPPVFERAGQALAKSLCANGLSIDCARFGVEFQEKLNEYYAERDRHLFELSTTVVLAQFLADKGQPGVPETILRAALDDFYAITQENWRLEADAASPSPRCKPPVTAWGWFLTPGITGMSSSL